MDSGKVSRLLHSEAAEDIHVRLTREKAQQERMRSKALLANSREIIAAITKRRSR